MGSRGGDFCRREIGEELRGLVGKKRGGGEERGRRLKVFGVRDVPKAAAGLYRQVAC